MNETKNDRCDDQYISSLQILAWNIHGLNDLKLKLHQEYLNDFDFITLSETWASDLSTFSLNKHKFYNFPRLSKQPLAFRNSGGLAIFVKHVVLSGIDIGFKSREGVVWSRFKKDFFQLPFDLYLASIYLSPADSKHTIHDFFSKY